MGMKKIRKPVKQKNIEEGRKRKAREAQDKKRKDTIKAMEQVPPPPPLADKEKLLTWLQALPQTTQDDALALHMFYDLLVEWEILKKQKEAAETTEERSQIHKQCLSTARILIDMLRDFYLTPKSRTALILNLEKKEEESEEEKKNKQMRELINI